jgi:preprotein translocase subunit SecY
MTSEFVRRAGFTLGALLIYRLGCNIPLPGINFFIVEHLFDTPQTSGLKSMLLASGNFLHLSIFALGITSYISAAVLLQLGGIVFGRLRRLQSEGERGRQTLRKLTFGLTIGLAAFQAYGVAAGLEHINGAVANPGALYLLSAVATLTAGTVFLAWLSEQMTAFGLGNGIALLLLSGTVTALRDPIATLADLNGRGLMSSNTLLSLIGLVVFVTGAIVAIERARRRFPIDYSPRQIGNRTFEGSSSDMQIKLNPAGIIPAILASWLLSIMMIVISLTARSDVVSKPLSERPVYLCLQAILIFVCAIFYSAHIFNPEETAERLQKLGGAVRSIVPGESTVTYLDSAVSRIVLFGGIYLAVICLLPDILRRYFHVPFYFGGLSLLILVCTVLDFEHQVRGYLGPSPNGGADPE